MSDTTRLYRAPQSSVRSDRYGGRVVVPDKARRRRLSGRFPGALEKQSSEASLTVEYEQYLQQNNTHATSSHTNTVGSHANAADEAAAIVNANSNANSNFLTNASWHAGNRAKQQQPRSQRTLEIQAGNEDFSDSGPAYDHSHSIDEASGTNHTPGGSSRFGSFHDSFSLLPHSLDYRPHRTSQEVSSLMASNYQPYHKHHDVTKSNKKRGKDSRKQSSLTTSIAQGFLSLVTYANVLQLLVLVMLAGVVFDGHHRVKKHKIQLQQYDEERAHLLEQMMWIDKAAKKVHQKAQLDKDVHAETREELEQDIIQARQETEKIQLRIQLNARDRLSNYFGDKPLQAKLRMPLRPEDDPAHLLLALSDDTPHAVVTLVEQLQKHVWDDIVYQKMDDGNVVQATAQHPTTTPLLEFVERSRGCSERGSVALRQLEERELHVIVLRFNMGTNTPMDDYDVCIGKVIQGLELLEAVE